MGKKETEVSGQREEIQEHHLLLLPLKMEEKGHTPRNMEGAREWILPQSLQKGTSPADTLSLA